MLDNLIDGLKGQVVDTLKEKTGLDAGQAEKVMPVAKDSITEGLMGAVSGGNVAGLMGMFSGGSGEGGGGMVQNAIYQGIASNFIGKLTSKLGIPAGMADKVSSFALPMIMNKMKGAVSNDSGEVQENALMSMIGMDKGAVMDGLKGKAMDAVKDKLPGGLGKLF